MSDNFYSNLRREIKKRKRRDPFFFSTYGEMIFAHPFMNRHREEIILEEKMEREIEEEVEREGGEHSQKPPQDLIQEVQREPEENLNFPLIYGLEFLQSQRAKIIFLGEIPRDFKEEDPDGDLLSKMILAMKLEREDYVKVFFDKDGQRAREQWNALLQILRAYEEITLLCLGAMATNIVLGKKERLSKIHGQRFQRLYRCEGRKINLSIFPAFHPDILLINPNMKRSAWIDLQKVMSYLDS